jgi:hypothetical protein
LLHQNAMHLTSPLIAWLQDVSSAFSETSLTVKLIKDRPSSCTAPPEIELPGQWQRIQKSFASGENECEIFFEIKSPLASPFLSRVTIVAPGVKVVRSIVGRTDVPFTQDGNRVSFQLVDDRSRGQLMQTDYQSPRGGLPISFIHEWNIRRAEQYAKHPCPEAQIEAIPNYLLAAQEALRLMGNMGPGSSKHFRGEIVLMGSRNSVNRGHLDHPHFRIMHYEFEPASTAGRPWLLHENPYGVKRWYSRLAPHFYMDDNGEVIINNYAVFVGANRSRRFGIGETCTLRDSRGKFVLDITIFPGSVSLRGIGGKTYGLRPDPEFGAAKAVYGYLGREPAFRVEAHDNAAEGIFQYQIDTIRNGKVVETFCDGYMYDPFTAKLEGNSFHG